MDTSCHLGIHIESLTHNILGVFITLDLIQIFFGMPTLRFIYLSLRKIHPGIISLIITVIDVKEMRW